MTYRSTRFVVTLAGGLIASLACGCEAILGLDWAPSDPAGDTSDPEGADGAGGHQGDADGSGAASDAPASGGSTGGSTEGACVVASCPAPAGACQIAACVGSSCASVAAPAGTPCAQDGGVICDGAGSCVECTTSTHCQGLGAACVNQACESCDDTIVNGLETDIDCGGGVCPKCEAGGACLENGDCKGKLKCIAGSCDEEEDD